MNNIEYELKVLTGYYNGARDIANKLESFIETYPSQTDINHINDVRRISNQLEFMWKLIDSSVSRINSFIQTMSNDEFDKLYNTYSNTLKYMNNSDSFKLAHYIILGKVRNQMIDVLISNKVVENPPNIITSKNVADRKLTFSKTELLSLDYFTAIKYLYTINYFNIAEDISVFDRNKHDGVIHLDCLCIEVNKFHDAMKEIYKSLKIPTLRSILTYLSHIDVIKIVRNGHCKTGQKYSRTINIHIPNNDKKLIHTRVVAIYLNKLHANDIK